MKLGKKVWCMNAHITTTGGCNNIVDYSTPEGEIFFVQPERTKLGNLFLQQQNSPFGYTEMFL
jgi:hypothetical protein